MSKEIRTRYAPSPTGFQHIGGVRTALYAWLFAKKNNGKLVLRIEDTDQSRYVDGAEQYIVDTLNWLNLPADEGVGFGGDCGPYRQSERKETYKKYALQLVQTGHAYYAFDSSEELGAARDKTPNFKYDAVTRKEMRNSLTLSIEEIEKLMAADVPYVIRLKIGGEAVVKFKDIVRGEVAVHEKELDDKVLFKSDGMPTYHLANIVDDHLMGITHVIRGEEWLPSTPLHVLLYRSLGWSKTMPQFAHLPLLMNPNGKGKLSKRTGDKLGFPVFPLAWVHPTEDKTGSGFKEDGYLPEALINFLAFLGWNPGTEQEIFSLDELVAAFSLERVTKAGSRFDIDKLNWYNQEYIKKANDQELLKIFLAVKPKDISTDEKTILSLIPLFKERITFPADFWDQASVLLGKPTMFDQKVLKKKWKPENIEHLHKIKAQLQALPNFTQEKTAEIVKGYIGENNLSFGNILQPLRLLLTGQSGGPDLFDVMAILGKIEVLDRFDYAFEHFPKS